MKCHQQKNQQISFDCFGRKTRVPSLVFSLEKEEREQSPIFFLRFHKENEFDGSVNGVCCLMLLNVSTSFN